MVDKSNIPCKKCGHEKSAHGSSFDISFDICWKCDANDYNNVGYCNFERMDNLEYLEWLYDEKINR